MTSYTLVLFVLTVFGVVLLQMKVAGQELPSPDYEDGLEEGDTPGVPYFEDTPLETTVRQGQVARLQCTVKNLGTKKIIWRRKSEPNPLTIGKKTFVDDKRFKVKHGKKSDNWHLTIKDVRLDDAGWYECQVSTTDREIRRDVELKVKRGKVTSKVEPRIDITGKTYVDEKHTIRLVCNATGGMQSPDDLDWFHDGVKLVTNVEKKIKIEKSVSLMDRTIYSVLEKEDAQMDNAGIYLCRTSDLQVASVRVDVLNAGTYNVKRGEKRLRETEQEINKSKHSGQGETSLGQHSGSSCLPSWRVPHLLLLSWIVAVLFRNDIYVLPT